MPADLTRISFLDAGKADQVIESEEGNLISPRPQTASFVCTSPRSLYKPDCISKRPALRQEKLRSATETSTFETSPACSVYNGLQHKMEASRLVLADERCR